MVVAASRRRLRGDRPRSTTTACIKGEPVPIHVKVTVKRGDMTIDLSRLLGRAQGRDQLAHLCRRARRLQGADRPARSGQRRLVPRAQGHHPRRQHHDGALPGADGGLERASCRPWSTPSSRRWPRRCRTACRPGTTALLGGAVVFFGTHPKTKRRFVVQSIEGGGWGGRPFEDGESGTVSVCQGDVRNGSIEGIELKCPVLVREPRAAHRLLRRRQVPRRARHRHAGANLVEGNWNFEHAAARQMPALGPLGRHAGRARRLSPEAAGRDASSRCMGGSHIPVPVGAEAIVRTGGGGGWGDPLERDAVAGRARCRGGLHLGRGRAQALRRGGPRQHVARRKRDPAAAKAAKVRPEEVGVGEEAEMKRIGGPRRLASAARELTSRQWPRSRRGR